MTVCKISEKPFKSGRKFAEVKGIVSHQVPSDPDSNGNRKMVIREAYEFLTEEDGYVVDVRRCIESKDNYMSYDEFLSLLEYTKNKDDYYINSNDFIKIACNYLNIAYHESHSGINSKNIEKLQSKFSFIYMKHEIGGYSGGNCWGDEATYYSNSEPMPEFESFYNILEKICPTIAFLKVKAIEREIIKTFEFTDYEYYGNCTSYIVKYFHIEDLYNILIKEKILTA